MKPATRWIARRRMFRKYRRDSLAWVLMVMNRYYPWLGKAMRDTMRITEAMRKNDGAIND